MFGAVRVADRLKGRNARPFFTTVLRPKTSIWEASGLHFGILGLHFGVFWEALGPLGVHFGNFGGICRKWVAFRRESVLHLGTLFGQKSIKIPKSCEKWVSGKQSRKKSPSDLTRSGPMWHPYSKYHMFRGVHLCQFEWLWDHFGIPFGPLFDTFMLQG